MTPEDDNNVSSSAVDETSRSQTADLLERATRIRVVLVDTSHPGNIGAAARAMKTMQLSELYLVRPKRFPCAESTARAVGADDLLDRAVVCGELRDALVGCRFVVGTSARSRHLEWPALAPRECATKVVEQSATGCVAIVFGRENAGLTNEELELCHAVVKIPTNPTFSSLNVAAAVQIIAYELSFALGASYTGSEDIRRAAADIVTSEQLEGFYEHLRSTLVGLGYLDESAPKLLMRRLRRLFSRAGLERAELNILRGILSTIDDKTGPQI